MLRCVQEHLVNRFFRSALFPLIVIVLLVYLASQTLMRAGTRREEAHLLGADQPRSRPTTIQGFIFDPNKQKISFELDGRHEGLGQLSEAQSDPSSRTCSRRTTSTSTRRASARLPWWSILTRLLPFVLLFGFWIFLMNQVQGGGSKVMSFGKSRAKRMTPDSPKIGFKDVAGVDEAVEELQEIRSSSRTRRSSRRSGRGSRRACCCTGRPEPARRCSRARLPARRACRSSRSRAPTSSRCSSASAPRVSATCSSRPSRPRRASCSWTRSTRSAAIAAPGWAAATTSASRR